MTETTTATTTTARSLHWGVTRRGQAIIGLGRLLDEYEAARWDHDERESHEHSQQGVQAEEACWIATQEWLWQGILEVETIQDVEGLACTCDELACDRQDGGHGWAAEVWEAVASYIRELIPVYYRHGAAL